LDKGFIAFLKLIHQPFPTGSPHHKMGREFKYRILLLGIKIPYDVEEKKSKMRDCECCIYGGSQCDTCLESLEEYGKYATSWQYYDRMSRYNDVLGMYFYGVYDEQELKKEIQQITQEMVFRTSNENFDDLSDYTEAIDALNHVIKQLWRSEWKVEIIYN